MSETKSKPTPDQRITQLVAKVIREVHASIEPALSMGDVAVYVGQPVRDAMETLAVEIIASMRTN